MKLNWKGSGQKINGNYAVTWYKEIYGMVYIIKNWVTGRVILRLVVE